MDRNGRPLQGCGPTEADTRLSVARHVTRRRSAVLVSLLAHAAALAAFLLAEPNVFPPAGVQVIEVALVDDPAVVALPFHSSTDASDKSADAISPEVPAERLPHPGFAYLTGTLDTVGAKRPAAPSDWVAPVNSALGRMPALSKLYLALYAKVELDWNMTAGALNCLDIGNRNIASTGAITQQTCNAKIMTASRSPPLARRDKNYDQTQPTSPFNIDWAPVMTDWDILMGQILR